MFAELSAVQRLTIARRAALFACPYAANHPRGEEIKSIAWGEHEGTREPRRRSDRRPTVPARRVSRVFETCAGTVREESHPSLAYIATKFIFLRVHSRTSRTLVPRISRRNGISLTFNSILRIHWFLNETRNSQGTRELLQDTLSLRFTDAKRNRSITNVQSSFIKSDNLPIAFL